MRIKERREEPYRVKMRVMMALALVRTKKIRGRVCALVMKRL